MKTIFTESVVLQELDEKERRAILDQIKTEKLRGVVNVQRFKGLGEMNPAQLRETTMAPTTRRLIQLQLDGRNKAEKTLDLLLARKRSGDRKLWLGEKGDQADVG